MGFDQLLAATSSKLFNIDLSCDSIREALTEIQSRDLGSSMPNDPQNLFQKLKSLDLTPSQDASIDTLLAYFILLFASRLRTSKKEKEFIMELLVVVALLRQTLEKQGSHFVLKRSLSEQEAAAQEGQKKTGEGGNKQIDGATTLLTMMNYFLLEVFFQEMTKLGW